MQWPTRVSDAEFVRRVERFHNHRRKFSISMILFSSISVGLGWYWIRSIESGLMPLIPDEKQSIVQVAATIGLFVGCFFSRRWTVCFMDSVGTSVTERTVCFWITIVAWSIWACWTNPRREIPDRQA
ncbi:MAG: hypothetical protein HQ518_12705 [Rhodopirellula sp.]|nr:hypothetical protein [Rhodopirellula sp.]